MSDALNPLSSFNRDRPQGRKREKPKKDQKDPTETPVEEVRDLFIPRETSDYLKVNYEKCELEFDEIHPR